jgi:hypothetical protein
MAYLLLSLVAGLFFLISGKVKYGKTLYLEGTKARIAGLIFLAPVGLILFSLMIIFLLAIFGIVISESSSDLIDNFASVFVRNCFLIGLAYINFYSVSRETKEQAGCLRYWLGYAIIISLSIVWFFLPALMANTDFFTVAAIGISILQLIFIIGIWLWKKWGVFGYAVANLITPIIAFLRAGSFSDTVISLTQALSLILVLFLLVKPKWQFFE